MSKKAIVTIVVLVVVAVAAVFIIKAENDRKERYTQLAYEAFVNAGKDK